MLLYTGQLFSHANSVGTDGLYSIGSVHSAYIILHAKDFTSIYLICGQDYIRTIIELWIHSQRCTITDMDISLPANPLIICQDRRRRNEILLQYIKSRSLTFFDIFPMYHNIFIPIRTSHLMEKSQYVLYFVDRSSQSETTIANRNILSTTTTTNVRVTANEQKM